MDLAVDVTEEVDVGHDGCVAILDEQSQQVAFSKRVALLYNLEDLHRVSGFGLGG